MTDLDKKYGYWPTCFRLKKQDLDRLERLAREWQTTKTAVIRRLLAMAETNNKERKDERTK